jgi:hypothetical protein
MGDLKSQLHRLLVERAKQVSVVQIAKDAGIDRSCLSLFRNKQRDLSAENIEKLRIFFGLSIELTGVVRIARDSPRLPASAKAMLRTGGTE